MDGFQFAPAVIAMRWPGMMLGLWQPSARQDRENSRMVDEKLSAGIEGIEAAGQAAVSICMTAATLWWNPMGVHRLMHAPFIVAEAAMTPAARTVKANAKRLSRRRP